jgi:ornithine cyclodeaminase/alanine dehydrogenase-like protein (mu-crystallin family)
MRYFTEDDVRRMLSMNIAIEVLRKAFTEFAAGTAKHQPRRRLFVDTGAVLHSMTGACGAYFGTKVYSTHPAHGAHFTVLLYEAATARPLAQLEANWLGQIRTGAVSGLAADCMAPEKPLRIGCIGTGFQARSQLAGISAVRPVASVLVWSRNSDKRERFAHEMSGVLDATVNPAQSAEECAEADVLVTATWAKDPVIAAGAVAPGTLVLAMGSNHPQRRELPGELVRSAHIVVEDAEACRTEAGDLLLALDDAGWHEVTELKHLISGERSVALTPDRVTVFKSVGIGLEDVAVAGWLYEQPS